MAVTPGMSSENPLTLSADELIASLRASGGYIAFVYVGWGWTQYVARRPETDQFEVLTRTQRPELTNGVVTVEPHVTDHYGMDEAGLRDWLPEQPTGPSDAVLHPINYEDTPFPDQPFPAETWEPGMTRERASEEAHG